MPYSSGRSTKYCADNVLQVTVGCDEWSVVNEKNRELISVTMISLELFVFWSYESLKAIKLTCGEMFPYSVYTCVLVLNYNDWEQRLVP
jgi:hypothetical protein